MLEELKKLNTGRVRVKIVALVLAMILTFTNFTLLGTYIGKETSYAYDESQDNETNALIEENIEEEDINSGLRVAINKTKLPTNVENEIEVTLELCPNEECQNLYSNPEIRIELPKEIKEAEITNITPVLHSEELRIKEYKIEVNQNGNKEIIIKVEGTQTKYEENNASIVVDVKVKTDSFMASAKGEIKTTVINKGEVIESKKEIELSSKAGFVTKNTLIAGGETEEEINSNRIEGYIAENGEITAVARIINNFGESLANVGIIGNIPSEMTLKQGVVTTVEGLEIYYSEDGANWTKEIEISKARAFKIVMPSNVEQGSLIEIGYRMEANIEGLEESKAIENILKIGYELEGQTREEQIVYQINAIVERNIALFAAERPETQTEAIFTPLEAETQEGQVKIELVPKALTHSLYQGQIVTYEIRATNTGTEELNDVKLVYTVPEGAVLTNLTYAQGTDITFEDKENVPSKTRTLEGLLRPGQTRVADVTVKIAQDASNITNSVIAQTAEETIGTYISETIPVNTGVLNVMLSRRDNFVATVVEKSLIENIAIVTNNTSATINNVIVTAKIPEGTSWVEDSENNTDWEYNSETRIATYTINSLESNSSISIRYDVKVNTRIMKSTIDNMIVANYNGQEYASNNYTSTVNVPEWNIFISSHTHDTISESEISERIEYTIKVTNEGNGPGTFRLIDQIPEEIEIQEITYYSSEDSEIQELTHNNNLIELEEVAGVEETITIEVTGNIKNLDDSTINKKITNIAKIDLGNGEYIESKPVDIIIGQIGEIEEEDPEENSNETPDYEPVIIPDDDNEEIIEEEEVLDEEPGENPGENPGTNPGTNPGEKPGTNPGTTPGENPGTNPGENPGTSSGKTYSISGRAWIDENKDGKRDSKEQVIGLQKVVLLDEKLNVIKEDKTSVTGTYKFTELKPGKYLVAIVYDNAKYAVTKYQVKDVKEDTNSDVIAKKIKLNDKEQIVGITDTIAIANKDIVNIDMGLIENAKFDLSLNKTITKVVVTTKGGETSTYEYENGTNLAKVEIASKSFSGATMLVEYEIEVANEGEVAGYVTDIIDYIPEGLTFNSELNPEWHMGQDKNLHYMAIEPKAIEAGKTQKVKLVLTKTLNNNSAGTIENIAEIGTSSNLEGIKELDSIAGNKAKGEDDISSASIIISVKTGEPILYIGIVIASMLILGAGIYIINKKVLRVNI